MSSNILPPGLPNSSGNLCCFNALLQMLAALPSFLRLLTTIAAKRSLMPYSSSSSSLSIPSLIIILNYLNNNNENNLDPMSYNNTIRTAFLELQHSLERMTTTRSLVSSSTLSELGQQDIHEYLLWILKEITFYSIDQDIHTLLRSFDRDILFYKINFNLPSSYYFLPHPLNMSPSDFLQRLSQSSKELQRYRRVLLGTTYQIITCMQCHISEQGLPIEFLTLELTLSHSSVISLMSILTSEFLIPSYVTNVECEHCSKIHNKLIRTKKCISTKLHSLPDILTIHFNRVSNMNHKNDDYVKIPPLLNMFPYLFTSSSLDHQNVQNYMYELKTVVEHMSNPFHPLTGHFITYRRWDDFNLNNDDISLCMDTTTDISDLNILKRMSQWKWIRASDEDIRWVSMDSVLLRQVYIAQYVKIQSD